MTIQGSISGESSRSVTYPQNLLEEGEYNLNCDIESYHELISAESSRMFVSDSQSYVQTWDVGYQSLPLTQIRCGSLLRHMQVVSWTDCRN